MWKSWLTGTMWLASPTSHFQWMEGSRPGMSTGLSRVKSIQGGFTGANKPLHDPPTVVSITTQALAQAISKPQFMACCRATLLRGWDQDREQRKTASLLFAIVPRRCGEVGWIAPCRSPLFFLTVNSPGHATARCNSIWRELPGSLISAHRVLLYSIPGPRANWSFSANTSPMNANVRPVSEMSPNSFPASEKGDVVGGKEGEW